MIRRRQAAIINRSIVSIAVLLCGFLFDAAQAQICSFCEGYLPPVHQSFPLSNGKKCFDVWQDSLYLFETDNRCKNNINKFRNTCCTDGPPPPTAAPVYTGPTGNQPICMPCKNDEFPGYPKRGVDFRYVGVYTCQQLYDRGRAGLNPGNVCEALQLYTYEYCGCGEHNPNCQGDPSTCVKLETDPPTPPPTPQPTPRPTPRPTPHPSPQPTPRPTPQPTPQPTPAPTAKPVLPTDQPSPAPYLPPFKDPPDNLDRVSLASLEGFGGAAGLGGNRRLRGAEEEEKEDKATTQQQLRGGRHSPEEHES